MSCSIECPWCGGESVALNDWSPVWDNQCAHPTNGGSFRRISTGAFCFDCRGHFSISLLRTGSSLRFEVAVQELA